MDANSPDLQYAQGCTEAERRIISSLMEALNAALCETNNNMALLSSSALAADSCLAPAPLQLQLTGSPDENKRRQVDGPDLVSVATQTGGDDPRGFEEQRTPGGHAFRTDGDLREAEARFRRLKEQYRRIRRRIRRIEQAASFIQSRQMQPEASDVDRVVQQIRQSVSDAILYCRQDSAAAKEVSADVDRSDCCCCRSCSEDLARDEGKWLVEAWELHSVNTRRRMTILARHYRKLYGQYRSNNRLVFSMANGIDSRRIRTQQKRLAVQLKRCRRRFETFRLRSRELERQYQIILNCIGRQVDQVVNDLREREHSPRRQNWSRVDRTRLQDGLAPFYSLLSIKLQWIRRRFLLSTSSVPFDSPSTSKRK